MAAPLQRPSRTSSTPPLSHQSNGSTADFPTPNTNGLDVPRELMHERANLQRLMHSKENDDGSQTGIQDTVLDLPPGRVEGFLEHLCDTNIFGKVNSIELKTLQLPVGHETVIQETTLERSAAPDVSRGTTATSAGPPPDHSFHELQALSERSSERATSRGSGQGPAHPSVGNASHTGSARAPSRGSGQSSAHSSAGNATHTTTSASRSKKAMHQYDLSLAYYFLAALTLLMRVVAITMIASVSDIESNAQAIIILSYSGTTITYLTLGLRAYQEACKAKHQEKRRLLWASIVSAASVVILLTVVWTFVFKLKTEKGRLITIELAALNDVAFIVATAYSYFADCQGDAF
ncbi:hypothetical protein LTS02_016125 [Friedmanniomyces endolithicus]|nr:hypothetical protein LTS02_016125 [Friedmanniomyces endolithicus]